MRPPAFSERGGAIEQGFLLFDTLHQRSRTHAPLGVRVASPDARSGAGRVDEHKIDAAAEVGDHVRFAARRAYLDVARAGAGDAFMDRRELALVDVGRVNLAAILHHGGQRQGFSAGAGGQIDDLFAGLGAGEQRGELRAFVLDFDRTLAKARLGMDGRAFRFGRKPNAQPDRRPSRRLGVKMRNHRQHLITLELERIDAHVERRPARQRGTLGAAFILEDARQVRIEPVRIIAQNGRRRTREPVARQRRSLRLGQWCRGKTGAAAQRRDRRDVEAALALQHPDQHGARAGLAHQPRRRRFAPQRIVHQTGDRGAIRRAGKAMREAPVLERVRRRPPPRFDVGDDLDSRRKARRRRHAGVPLEAAVISWRA